MRIYAALAASTLSLLLCACNGNRNHENNEAARQLFLKSKHLTEEYIDSIQHAVDSVAVSRMVENFNIKLTTVNYQFPADTDLDLTEEENDSLIRMFTRFGDTVEKRLKGFAPKKESQDSIAKDSIAARPVVAKQAAAKPVEVREATPPSHISGNQTED